MMDQYQVQKLVEEAQQQVDKFTTKEAQVVEVFSKCGIIKEVGYFLVAFLLFYVVNVS